MRQSFQSGGIKNQRMSIPIEVDAEKYQGFRIQISKEKSITKHLVENPIFYSDEEAPLLHAFESTGNFGAENKKKIDMHNLNYVNAQAIDSVAGTRESNTNLLFYNFNDFNAYGSNKRGSNNEEPQGFRRDYKNYNQRLMNT